MKGILLILFLISMGLTAICLTTNIDETVGSTLSLNLLSGFVCFSTFLFFSLIIAIVEEKINKKSDF